jgi:large subunit ribosomal protein L24
MIKKGDNIIVIAGGEKGKKGKVLRVLRPLNRVIVEGVNMKKKHQKARRNNEKGQIIELATPMHLSNVMILEGNKPVRMGKKTIGDKKVRISRKSGSEI